MTGTEQFDSVLYAISENIRRTLEFLPQSLKEKTEEIRLRAGQPLALTVSGKTVFVRKDGGYSQFITRDLISANPKDLEESFKLLCHNSVYAHEEEISNGYIMMEGGHRAGLCGTLVNGYMRDITSINIRIARQIFGCATRISERFDGGGVLIAGPPGSGKTTMLRDLIKQLSNGESGTYQRVAVVDSRGELAGNGMNNDLGPNTDVLFCHDKAFGAQLALRTMFPDIIAFDEIGTAAELNCVSECFNAGVCIITTAHIGAVEDLRLRSVTSQLLNSGAIETVVILPPDVGDEFEIMDISELEYGGFN